MGDFFYSGFWAVNRDLRIDREAWAAPNSEDQWVTEAGAFEDLNIDWEDIDVFPQEMFSGSDGGSTAFSEITFTEGGRGFYSIFADDYADFEISPSENFYTKADPRSLPGFDAFYILFDEPDTSG